MSRASEGRHTAGPWSHEYDGALFGRDGTPLLDSGDRAVTLANAARIVACVNFCEGKDNTTQGLIDYTECGGLTGLFAERNKALADRDALRAQVAELTAALRGAEFRASRADAQADEARAERDMAVSMLRVIGEETVMAGYPGGDREQTLANVRAALAGGK